LRSSSFHTQFNVFVRFLLLGVLARPSLRLTCCFACSPSWLYANAMGRRPWDVRARPCTHSSMKSCFLLYLILPHLVCGKRLVDKKSRTWAKRAISEADDPIRVDITIDVQGKAAALKNAQSSQGGSGTSSLEGFVANDLWGIRDLLLIGYSAIFMKPDSSGRSEVESAALQLARLLPEVHPYEPCRTAVKEALTATNDTSLKASPRLLVAAVAEATWNCLPGHFSELSFDAEFTFDASSVQDLAKDFDSAKFAKMAHPAPDVPLGLCRGSHWPRTCSYWVSMHRMAYLADSKSQGKAFLAAVVPLLAGGATLCNGCTAHFRFLNDAFLTEAVRSDIGTGFCSGAQCASSKAHLDEFRKCTSGNADASDSKCSALSVEKKDVFSYQDFLKTTLKQEMWPASAILVALHNVVTKSIDRSFFPDGRGIPVCLSQVLKAVSSELNSNKSMLASYSVDGSLLQSVQQVPGLGPLATPSCSST